MKIAVYSRGTSVLDTPRLVSMMETLKASGFEFYSISSAGELREGTGMVMSVGGDGTFLSASKRVGKEGIPVLGVNMGRVGFLGPKE